MRKNAIMKNWKDWGFYFAVVTLPILQFIIFYIVVNINSIAFAFQEYNPITLEYEWNNFENFTKLFSKGNFAETWIYLKNSLFLALFTIVLAIPVALFFSYYIFKKRLAGDAFATLLYLPSIISGAVLVLSYTIFVDRCIPEIVKTVTGKYMPPPLIDNLFVIALVFTVWFSFGSSSLIYTSTMEKINRSTLEAASLDGVTPLKEFVLIIIPQMIPTISTFIATSIAGIFVHQMNLFTFSSMTSVPVKWRTMGYYIYKTTLDGAEYYPQISTLGLFLTVIGFTLTTSVRRLLEKINPMK